MNLLLVQFKVATSDDIKDVDVAVDVWIIPRFSNLATICTARYALYWMAWRGLMRVLGQQAVPLHFNGWTRGFEYFSGRPYWELSGQKNTFTHPGGAIRKFSKDHGYFYWYHKDDQTGMKVVPDVKMW